MPASKDKVDLLFLTWSFSYGGGAERVLSNLICRLGQTGRYDISLMEVSHVADSWEPLPDGVRVLEPVIDETRTDLAYRLRRHRRRKLLDEDPARVRSAVRREGRHDLVVAFNYLYPTFLVLDDEPSISWNHGSIDGLERRPRLYELQREAYAKMDAIVAIAEPTRRSIEALYPELAGRVRLIHNGFDFAAIREQAQTPCDIELAHPAVVMVGRLDENKDPVRAVRAFSTYARRNPDAHFYFVGDGVLADDVRQAASAEGVAGRVHLLGYHKNPYPIMRQADCLLTTSAREGFQTVIVEALALGVPFVSTPAGSAEELSGDGAFGVVASASDEIADGIERMVAARQDPGFADGMRRFVSRYDLDAQVDAFEALADEVLEKERDR